jgi:hypothetical protein
VKVHPAAGSPRISGGFLSRTQREPFQPPIEPSGRIFSVSFAILYVPVFRRRAKWIPLGFSRVFPAPKPASLYLFGLRICRPDRLLDRGGEAPPGRCSSEGVPQGDCISEAPRLRRRTRSMTPPGTPKSGEFGKNGTIRRFLRPIRALFHYLTTVEKIRANRRYWTGDLLSNGLWWAEMK